MQVFCLGDLDELAPYADDWDRLARDVPFRGWNWLSTWWRHYGQDERSIGQSRLFVPCVFDHTDRLVGLAPWYLTETASSGRVIRPLGDGEVCSDYLSVLCLPGMEDAVGDALAEYLVEKSRADHRDAERWDLIELSGIDAEDRAMDFLAVHLRGRDCVVHGHPGPNCWRITLPATWDEYLAMLSKSHRKQNRRIERRMFDTGRAQLHQVQSADDVSEAVEILIDLHLRRRRSLGEEGSFESARFAAFHREVIPKLLSAGQLQLHWLTLDGKPVAAEYHLAGGGVVYAYQGGIDPAALKEQPGKMAVAATIRRAIEQGYRAYDFLRGDEPVKPHWRASPRPALQLRIVPPRAAARVRHGLWVTGSHLKRWAKNGLGLVGMRSN